MSLVKSPQTLRTSPSLQFDVLVNDSEVECFLFASEGNLGTSLLSKNEESIRMEDLNYLQLGFKITGISSKNERIAMFGENDCSVAQVNIKLNSTFGEYFL